jgi:hypothetical protein
LKNGQSQPPPKKDAGAEWAHLDTVGAGFFRPNPATREKGLREDASPASRNQHDRIGNALRPWKKVKDFWTVFGWSYFFDE